MNSNIVQNQDSYIWKISNFSVLKCSVNKIFRSPDFKDYYLPGTTWSIHFSPLGSRENEKQFASVFLTMQNNTGGIVHSRFSIEILNENGAFFHSKSLQCIFCNFTANGWNNYIETDKIFNLAMKSSDDAVTFRCRKCRPKSVSYTIRNVLTNTTVGITRVSLKYSINDLKNFSNEYKKFTCTELRKYTMSLHNSCNNISIVIKTHFTHHVNFPRILRVFIFDNDSFEFYTNNYKIIFNPQNNLCILRNIIPKLLLKRNGNGSFTIICMFVVYNYEICHVTEIGKHQPLTSFHLLSSIDSLSDVQEVLFNLYNSGKYCDTVLQSADWKISVHKFILVARSPHFSKILEKHPTNPIMIYNVEYFVMKIFVKFLYVGIVEDLDYETALKLLLLAEKYEVHSLKNKCLNFRKRTESESVYL